MIEKKQTNVRSWDIIPYDIALRIANIPDRTFKTVNSYYDSNGELQFVEDGGYIPHGAIPAPSYDQAYSWMAWDKRNSTKDFRVSIEYDKQEEKYYSCITIGGDRPICGELTTDKDTAWCNAVIEVCKLLYQLN